ncbi:hypothetical protein SV7mr_05060 [Stieleria bergensis]|uniref:Uncharacterized protein n=1 Tax=Stieleria bergensis TaxID=2528025 RepID=A0A517SPG0_9BACT|nr:hypothetical protein SV7mr_05060 [Planctomycetes bacterium SV_7m_r]
MRQKKRSQSSTRDRISDSSKRPADGCLLTILLSKHDARPIQLVIETHQPCGDCSIELNAIELNAGNRALLDGDLFFDLRDIVR